MERDEALGELDEGVRLSWNVSPRGVTGRARDNARVLRRYQTPAEAQLWNALRGRKIAGLKFRRQVPVGRFIVDFLCFEAGLIIEADGSQHADVNVHEYDDERTRYLQAQGLDVLRFTNKEIESNLPGIIDRIAATAQARLSSSPLPRGRGAGGEAIALPITQAEPLTPYPSPSPLTRGRGAEGIGENPAAETQESEPIPCVSS